jgi:hypothetical protein
MNLLKIFFYGFLLWLVPFVLSFAIYPLKKSGSPLFETIITVVLISSVMVFTILYARRSAGLSLITSILVSLVWLAMSLTLDFLFFIWGPPQITISAYISDIGLTYLIYPVIIIGFGVLLRSMKSSNPNNFK